MTAPIMEQVRTALEARMARYTHDGGEAKLREAIVALFDLLDYHLPDVDDPADALDAEVIGDDFYCDLRPSEAARLHEIAAEGAEAAFHHAREAIIGQVENAAAIFHHEYPNAPRRADHPRPEGD